MKIAILGYGLQGQAAYEYWNKPGNELTICDQNAALELPKGAESHLGADHLQGLEQFDLLVRSPAIHPKQILDANPGIPGILEKATTVTNEFFKVCPTKSIIGVTGTKGKGTTSTLITKMLEAAGKKVHLGANIGVPPLTMLKQGIQPDDWVVLELANFQLIDIKYSPHIGVCLMVTSEHLDWHLNYDEYITAKQQMFVHQTEKDIAIYYAKNEHSKRVVSVSKGKIIPYMQTPGAVVENGIIKIDGQQVCETGELKLLGQHNWQNACAAVTAVWQIIQDMPAMRKVLTSFTGLEHRLELVKEIAGVKYYDDSFGTTPETAVVAIESFSEPKVLVLGGSDKGANYTALADAVKNGNVRAVLTIGQTGPKIAEVLRAAGFNEISEGGNNMQKIVDNAKARAKAGDVVLLSPACASFGMFKDYKDRGEQFSSAVKALA